MRRRKEDSDTTTGVGQLVGSVLHEFDDLTMCVAAARRGLLLIRELVNQWRLTAKSPEGAFGFSENVGADSAFNTGPIILQDGGGTFVT